jgi:hypothetical protein
MHGLHFLKTDVNILHEVGKEEENWYKQKEHINKPWRLGHTQRNWNSYEYREETNLYVSDSK